ncbi:MAG: DUF6597 domain-containing transcriptional factor [Alphaproteobacteria bacterium]
MTPDEELLVLAGATGAYREVRPPAALDAHFQCIWSNACAQGTGRRLAVVPDGCVDLTWNEGELMVAGPDVTVAVTPLAAGSTVVGVRFRPGAARAWLGLPLSEIVGGRMPLCQFWGRRAGRIAARVGDAPTTAGRMRVLAETLGRVATDIEIPPPEMGFVFAALRTGSTGHRMANLSDQLDTSPRTLRRRCREAFGYGPKTLDRILRFQRFLDLARGEEPRLADLASASGYADQAHLTREVRRLSGLSPTAVLAQLAA